MTTVLMNEKMPSRDTARQVVDIRFLKLMVLVNGLVPGALLAWDAWHHQLGANPVNFAIRTTGMLTLIFLPLSLLVTPLRKITGLQWLFYARRSLGLFAFFYGMSHFLLFFVLDRELDVSSTLSEMLERKYLLVGSAGLLFMTPLAATSFNFMIKKMGSERWQRLHRLAYVAAIAGVVHYYMLVKADIRLPVIFAVVITGLLGYRVADWTIRRKSAAAERRARWSGQLRVKKITRETPQVTTFQLAGIGAGALPFKHQPGQHLSIMLHIEGKKIYRSYTIASAPLPGNYCELTIKREHNGTASRFLHDHIRVGDLLDIVGFGGTFTFNSDAKHPAVALLAGGVGITPFMSIIRHLTASTWRGQIYLVYSNTNQSEIIFKQELDSLAAQYSNLRVHYTLTRETDPAWTGRVGRIDGQLLQSLIPCITNMPVYICGPSMMIESMQQILGTLGVPSTSVHIESFETQPAVLDTNSPLATYTLTFAKSGKQVPARSDRPLLELAEEARVPAEFECRSGICGSCKCRLIAGSVQMVKQDALTAEDRAGDIILLCQARAQEDVTIDA